MRVRSADKFLQVLQPHVGLNLGARDLRVVENRLDVAEIRVVLQQVRGHGVMDGMRSHRLPVAAPPCGPRLDLPHCADCDPPAVVLAYEQGSDGPDAGLREMPVLFNDRHQPLESVGANNSLVCSRWQRCAPSWIQLAARHRWEGGTTRCFSSSPTMGFERARLLT